MNLGGGCQRGRTNLVEATLVGYMNAAATWWEFHGGRPVNLYLPPSRVGQKPKLRPFLWDIVNQRVAWKEPRKKRLPLTIDMYEALAADLQRRAKIDASIFLGRDYAILNWAALSLHTGSRLSEYGQSKRPSGVLFNTVPRSPDAGEWAGTPIAFIRDDWMYYDRNLIRRSYHECLQDCTLAAYFHCRFRFDKSKHNFTLRKYARMHGSMLCPIKSSLTILARADRLGLPKDYPIGIFRPIAGAPGEYSFITGDDVSHVLQRACCLAYPDVNHYMRENINLLKSHSFRITAAVALHNAGVSIPVIAFRLRWDPESVKHYIRDCFTAVGPLTSKAIAGAFLN